MIRWRALLLFCLLTSCGEKKYTAQECKGLELTAVQRCFGGDLKNGKYVGDLKCWPFSKPHRIHGVWLLNLETSVFAPNATAVTATAPSDIAWLETDLLNQPSIVAAMQGAGPRAYLIDFDGRQALCNGNFGHLGMSPREVIVDQVHSLHRIAVPST